MSIVFTDVSKLTAAAVVIESYRRLRVEQLRRPCRWSWRMRAADGAYIHCDRSREDRDTLRMLCGYCIDAPEYVPYGATQPNFVAEPIVTGVPRY